MERESDAQLIQRILAGDEAAFDVLVQRHQKSVHALAWRKIGDFHDAEEITQDTFLQVYKKLPTLKDPYKFAGWLYVIANRLCIDRMRQKNLTTQSLEDTPMAEVENASYTHHVSEQRQTEITERRRAIVKELLEKLPESERTVMTLFYLGEMTVKEISKFLGVSASAIHNRLYRARKRLQEEEALLVQEVLGGVQIPASVSQNIMQRVADIKLTPQATPKPVLPWIAFGTAFLLLALLFGTSNQYLTRFQKPYSFEAQSEPTIVIIDAPIVLETDVKPAVRNQVGRAIPLDKSTSTGLQGHKTGSTTELPRHPENVEAWMPDPNLRWFVRERLEIADNIPMIPRDLLRLTDIEIRAEGIITNLQGLEHAVNLESLVIKNGKISDLTPLAGLQKIRVLKFYGSNISDLTPIAGLVNLAYLNLLDNNISDITPLDGLVNLKVLLLGGNQIIDFTLLHGLVGIETLDLGDIPIDPEILQRLKPVDPPVICEIARAPIRPRIENRGLPSVVQACGNIINMPRLSREEKIAYHDLFFCRETFGWTWTPTPDGNLRLIGDLEKARSAPDRMRAQNPNLILLTSIEYYAAYDDEYPEDSPYILRDGSGNRLRSQGWDHSFLDFTHSAVVQERVIQQAIEVAKCGIFDGIAIGHWTKGHQFERYNKTLEEEHAARDRIIQSIRDAVDDDFLIVVTTTDMTIPRHAEYINGLFMGTTDDWTDEGGYTYAGLAHIENTLLWAEKNLREPQINSLAGRGERNEPLDSPRNLQWMRLWTTMSLTHSDGYVMFTMGGDFDHPPHTLEFLPGHADAHAQDIRHTHQNQKYWYDFYDAPLGRPVGGDETKAQLYENREGLFIREFTNGWAVYNRSGTAQEIELPQAVFGWSSGVKDKRRHTLADLDGEIYLKKVSPPTDVNGDGIVNILDLVAVANAFGKDTPDVNDDGTVNVLDLVAVANAFEQ